jgi:hypothetical protein
VSQRGGRLILAAIATIAIAGCGELGLGDQATHGPTAAPGGLSKDAAVARALAALPRASATPAVVGASIESDPFAPRGNVPPGPLTWIVRVQGGVAASPCPSGWLDRPALLSDGPCLDGDGGVDVVLDFFTGDLIGWTH